MVHFDFVISEAFVIRNRALHGPLLSFDELATFLFLGPIGFDILVNQTFLFIAIDMLKLEKVIIFILEPLELAVFYVSEHCEKESLPDIQMGRPTQFFSLWLVESR